MSSRRAAIVAVVAIIAVVVALRFRTKESATSADGGTQATESADQQRSANSPAEAPVPRKAMVKTASIAGRVRDERGAPIAGASVCANASAVELVSADTNRPSCAQSDAEGKYVIEQLLPARYTVDGSAPAFRPARFVDAQHAFFFALKTGETRTGIDLVLAQGGVEVHGTVKDIAGGVVVGALVAVHANDAFDQSLIATFVTSRSDGEFSAWVAPGRVSVSATAIGYTKGTREGVAPGQRLEVLLTPESVLQGRVVEAGTDTPVAGARVEAGMLRGEAPPFGAVDESALSDDEGRFRIAGLEPGRFKPTATTTRQWGSARESVLLGLAETSREIVIEVQAAPSLIGRIELENKAPCTDGGVTVRRSGTQERRSAGVDSEGRLRVEGLLPGKYQVEPYCHQSARDDKYEPVVMADKDVTVVWKVSSGLSVAGTVLDADGKAIPDATVQARGKAAEARGQAGWSAGRTSRDGSFRLRGLHPGTYAFRVMGEGAVEMQHPLEVQVDHDVEGLVIKLGAGGKIEGRVVDGTGAPVAGVSVRAKGERWDWVAGRSTSRDDGSFVLSSLRPGPYHVQAEQNWVPVRAPGTTDDDVQGTRTTVTATETARVRLVVESRNGQIKGTVVDENGVLVSDAFVDAEREPESAGAQSGSARRTMQGGWWNEARSPVLTDLEGHFTIGKLAPGTYTVRAYRKGGGEAVAESVKVGATVTLKIKREGSIAGTVVDAKGAASERFSISARDPKTGVARSESFTRTGGTWALRDLPEGNYIVAAEGAGRGEARVSLAQGEKKEGLKIVLAPNASARGRVVSLETGEPIAKMMVFARAKNEESFAFFEDEDEGGRKNISDADGRFEVVNAPAGRVTLNLFHRDGETNDTQYGFATAAATLAPGAMTELPPIAVAKARVRGDLTGDLGFGYHELPPETDVSDWKYVVSFVRPNGPAARAKLVVGDEIIAVDGYDITPPRGYLYETLSRVPEGTTLKLGLKRGVTIDVRAEAPRAPAP